MLTADPSPTAPSAPTRKLRPAAALAWQRLLARPGLALALILALALLLRLVHINRNMWVDELITWNAIQFSFREMLDERFRCGHLPAYYALMHFWPGQNPGCAWLLRLPSLGFGLLAVALTYRLGRLGYRPGVALGGAALLALHSGALWSSQVARAYSLLMALNLFASIALLRCAETRKPRYAVGLFAATLLGYLTQVQYFFTLLAQLLYIAWAYGRRGYRQWPVLAALALATLAAIPAYRRLGHEQKEMENKILVHRLNLSGIGDAAAGLLVGEYKFTGLNKKAIIPAEVLMLAILLLTLRGSGKERRLRQLAGVEDAGNAAGHGDAAALARARALTRYLACWAGIHFIVLFLYLKMIPLTAQGLRYYWAFMGGITLGLAAALSLIRPVALRRGLALLTVAFMLIVTVGWLQYPGDGIFSAIPYLEKQIRPGEPLIGLDGKQALNALRFAGSRLIQAGYGQLDRQINDTRQLLADLQRQTANSPTFWLMVYHPQASPALTAIGESGNYRLLESERFHETKLYHYARK